MESNEDYISTDHAISWIGYGDFKAMDDGRAGNVVHGSFHATYVPESKAEYRRLHRFGAANYRLLRRNPHSSGGG